MNLTELQHKLIAAARAHPPCEAVPYAFERRIMAHVGAHGLRDQWTLWAVGLWRAAAPSVAVMIVVVACAFWLNQQNGGNDTQTTDLESTVYAGLDNLGEAW